MSWQHQARRVIRLLGAVMIVLSLSTPAISVSACVSATCDATCAMHAASEPETCCPDLAISKKAPQSGCKCIKAPVECSSEIDTVAPVSFPPVVCLPDPLPIPEPIWIDLTSGRRIIDFSDGSPPTVLKGPHSGRAPPCPLALLLASRA